MDTISYILAAVTALATGTTAVVAFRSLKNEREKTRLNILSESIRTVFDGPKNYEARDYLESDNKYNEDIAIVMNLLGIEQKDEVGLDDFERIVIYDYIKDGLNLSDDDKNKKKEAVRVSYKKIVYFCERMEYLGIIAENKSVQSTILNYYESTIKKTYEKLEKLIDKTREQRQNDNLYKQYTHLYNLAKENKKYKQSNQYSN